MFAGQPMEDVGGALALLTAMLLAGVRRARKTRAATHGLADGAARQAGAGLIPAFLETVEEQGGWDEMRKKGRH